MATQEAVQELAMGELLTNNCVVLLISPFPMITGRPRGTEKVPNISWIWEGSAVVTGAICALSWSRVGVW